MARSRGKKLTKKQRFYLILLIGLLVFSLLVEVAGRIPSIPFNGWSDVYAWFNLEPEKVVPEGELQVHFIDVGNADCILVRQEQFNLLIDAGEKKTRDDVLDYLNRYGVERLDLVVSTHPDADHIGAMADVLNAVTVDRFVMAYMPQGKEPTTKVYADMLEALDTHGVNVIEAHPGDVYEVGTARLQVLAPLEESSETNAMSIVTRLTFGDRAFLFTGDADQAVERQIMTAGYTVKADVLKVGHHGSKYSSSEAFLHAVDPEYAVITCGAKNKYNHPHDETLQRLVENDIPYIRADVKGDIVFKTDGTNLTVETEVGG